MDDKQAKRVTLEDLASMIERNIAHKEDIDRLENHLVRIDQRLEGIEGTLRLLAGTIADLRDLTRRIEKLEAHR